MSFNSLLRLLFKISLAIVLPGPTVFLFLFYPGTRHNDVPNQRSMLETKFGHKQKLECMGDAWVPKDDTHPGAPIYSLPRGNPDFLTGN